MKYPVPLSPASHTKDNVAPRDVAEFAHDLARSVTYALERGHLDDLTLENLPTADADALPPLRRSDYAFLKVRQIGISQSVDRSLHVQNLQNLLGVFRQSQDSFVFSLHGDGAFTHLYMGARHLPLGAGADSTVAYDAALNLKRTVEGVLPGTGFEEQDSPQGPSFMCSDAEVASRILNPIGHFPYLAAVTGVPAARTEGRDGGLQSLDRFIEALQDRRYQLVVIAEPIAERAVNDVLHRAMRLGSEMHSLVRTTLGRMYAESMATTQSMGTTVSEGEGVSAGESAGTSQGKAKTPIAPISGLVGIGVALALTPSVGPAAIGVGGMASSLLNGIGGGVTDTESSSVTTSRTRNWSEAFSQSLSEAVSHTDTLSLTTDYLNKTAEHCETLIDKSVRRLQRGKSIGMWNVGVYFLAEDAATFAQGRALLQTLFSGDDSYAEPVRTLNLSHPVTRRSVGTVLSGLTNPVLDLRDPETGETLRHPLGRLHRGLSTPLNAEELALVVNLPRREAPGIPLAFLAPFGLNPPAHVRQPASVGRLMSHRKRLPIPIRLELTDLARHTFITGNTGSGKTNTTMRLLKAALAHGCGALVIEPVKADYRNLLNDPDIPALNIFTVGEEAVSPLRINPFQFVPGTNLTTHIDLLKSIFNATFPMYAAMPYILEEAIFGVYADAGWDPVTSLNRHCNMERVRENWRRGEHDYSYVRHLPTLYDLLRKVSQVVSGKEYSQNVSGDYTAALRVRVNNLLMGSKGAMLGNRQSTSYRSLFDEITLVEMRGVGDEDDRAFVTALLLTQLYQYREQQYRWGRTRALGHLTVWEEAHRLLSRDTSRLATQESANTRGKAVATFVNLLAEIREYGEGFVIVDQSPTQLVPEVIKNTATKFIHKLEESSDLATVGDALGLTSDQIRVVSTLPQGEAILRCVGAVKAMHVCIDSVKHDLPPVSDDQVRAHMGSRFVPTALDNDTGPHTTAKRIQHARAEPTESSESEPLAVNERLRRLLEELNGAV